MEVSGQLHAPTALPPRKESLMPIGYLREVFVHAQLQDVNGTERHNILHAWNVKVAYQNK
jgi:hypothetical protein